MGSLSARLAYAAGLISVTVAQSGATIPNYVLDFAPLVYLDVNEQYFPSDIGAQVTNTYPAINFTQISDVPSNLSLSDLSSLNQLAQCNSFGTCGNLYLTSKTNITNEPTAAWLQGVQPNPSTGETEGVTSCAVIVTDHGNGTVDAFYMFFYAWNQGIPVGSPNGTDYDDHVGDWEHMMVRFDNGQPVTVYYSIHSGGQAYTYDATIKNGSRPVGFASAGGHATYPQEGIHVMYAGAANDSTSRGTLWDPVAGSGAWYYTFTPASPANFSNFNGTFAAVNVENRTARGTGPTDWLYFFGHWGDKMKDASYPGQSILGSITAVFTDGPTGPLDKDLYRSEACPDGGGCLTQSSVAAATGTVVQTISRSTGSATTPTSSRTSGAGASPTSKPNAAISLGPSSGIGFVAILLVSACQLAW